MNEQFNLEFICNRERMTATCEKFKGPKYIQFRVLVTHADNTEERFDFFEVNQPGQKFAWFNYTPQRNKMSSAIAKQLIERNKPQKADNAARFRTFLVYTILFVRALGRVPGQIRASYLNLKLGYDQVLAEVAKAERSGY